MGFNELSILKSNSISKRNSISERNSMPKSNSMLKSNSISESNSMSEWNSLSESNSIWESNSISQRIRYGKGIQYRNRIWYQKGTIQFRKRVRYRKRPDHKSLRNEWPQWASVVYAFNRNILIFKFYILLFYYFIFCKVCRPFQNRLRYFNTWKIRSLQMVSFSFKKHTLPLKMRRYEMMNSKDSYFSLMVKRTLAVLLLVLWVQRL